MRYTLTISYCEYTPYDNFVKKDIHKPSLNNQHANPS